MSALNHAKEPLSGAQGDVSKGEPFDAGNLDAEAQARLNKDMGGVETPIEGAIPDADASNTSLPGAVAAADDEPEIDPKTLEPGPRPLAELAREHGGDAGAAGSGNNSESSGLKGDDAEGDNGESKGSGELYVKSTGLAADGGNFDVTQPGAGREAERLMDEKGVRPDGDSGAAAAGHTADDKPKEKGKLVDRIKEKLHMH